MCKLPIHRCSTWRAALLAGLIGWQSPGLIHADPPPSGKEPAKASSLPTGTLSPDAWLKQPTTPLEPGEIDRLVEKELQKVNLTPAALTTDEQFLRRVTIDLTGRLPTASEMTQYLADKSYERRAKAIDRLLDSDDYAKHWARYWREVISSRSTDFRANLFARHFEQWLTKQLKDNKTWAEITRAMVTATGPMRNDEPDKNGEGYFFASRSGADAVTERAAETSRVFLGIQIQCAQCHDHPSDVWKRKQFHEFAAHFARLRDRPIFEEMRLVGVQLTSIPFGEHQMADTENPKKTTPMQPRFLDGKTPGFRLGDQPRRKALADFITSKDNPWFAGAFVNRLWGELLGQSFYQPVDDMGPQKDAVMPVVLARVAASFRGSDYDIKGLLRAVLNSQTYQRQIRPGDGEDHLLFAASNPRRMSADALWQTLTATLGPLNQFGFKGPKGPKGPFGPGGFRGGLEGSFKREFQFDPSTKPDEVEGSISQALMLMNNPVIHQKIQAKGNTMLARVLESNTDNDEAIKALYQRTLGRRPTTRELDRSREHLRAVTSRSEAFEDLLWALINSTEFQTRR